MKRSGLRLLVIVLLISLIFSSAHAVTFDVDEAAKSVLKVYAFENIGDTNI